MKLVVNASPLILLIAANQLSILRDLAEVIVVPEDVLTELAIGNDRDQAANLVQRADWITRSGPLPSTPKVAAWDLGAGETSVIAFADANPGFACVLDDRAARNCARSLELPYVGTLGLVLAAKEVGLIEAARPVLQDMKQAGYYLANQLLDQALHRAGE